MQEPNWHQFRAALTAVAIGGGLIAVATGEVLGYWLVFLGLALAVFSLRPTIESFPIIRRYQERKRDQRAAAEAARQEAERAAEQARTRQQLEPLISAWDAFYPAAGDVAGRFYDLRDGGPPAPEDWQAFTGIVQRALSLAEGLQPEMRDYAKGLLRPFAEADPERLDSCSLAACDLSNWRLARQVDSRSLRRRAGLPATTAE